MALSGWGVFLIIFGFILFVGGVGYVVYTQYRRRRLGLPPPNLNPFRRNRNVPPSNYTAPAPAPGGIVGWVQGKWHSVRNTRSAGGAYENTGFRSATQDGSGRRGFGPLDPDEAWDARVDAEAGVYYEEQELGLHDPSSGPYGGGGYGGELSADQGRGRSRSRQRELDERYDEEVHGGAAVKSNPFGDNAEPSSLSLRSISPRPHVEARPQGKATRPGHTRNQSSVHTKGSLEDSPTERRSVFQENM